jgi:peptidoglycan/LPS O-acetylase OafA/YrhL
LAHTWSLGVEEQYYLLFPILAWAALGSTGRERSLGWAPVAALCVGSFGICALLARTYWPYALFLMPARFWELGVGMLLALTLARWAPFVGRNRAFALACVALGSAAIGIGLCVPITPTFPFPGAILPVAGATALVAHVAARPYSSVSRLLSTPPARWTGRISYSLYLWHWPVIALFRAVGLDRAPHMLAAVALSFGLAYVSYRFVEQPFRRPRTTALS